MSEKYWYNKLFKEEVTEIYKIELVKELKKEFQQFYETYDDSIYDTDTNKNFLNEWYGSKNGQEELLKLMIFLWKKLTENSLDAMPSHDARHALFKVPTYSLKYIRAEKIQGWEKVGIIGALCHDYGRWAEERIFGNAQGGSTHSRMSYVLTKEILQSYQLPELIRKVILHSVLKHTTGAVSTDSMPVKLTVSPDRDQLVGPEMILRIFHHKPKDDSLFYIFDKIGQESLMEAIIRMYFSRLPGPLYSLDEEVRSLFKITLTFVLVNTSLEKIMFYKERFKTTYFKEIYFNEDLEWAKKEINIINNINININLEDVVLKMLQFKNVCPKTDYQTVCLNKFKNISIEQKSNLTKSLNWVNEKRLLLDWEQYNFLTAFRKNNNDQWLQYISQKLLENWF